MTDVSRSANRCDTIGRHLSADQLTIVSSSRCFIQNHHFAYTKQQVCLYESSQHIMSKISVARRVVIEWCKTPLPPANTDE